MIGHCKLVGYLALHGQFRLQTFQSSYKAKWPHITGTFSNFELKIFKRHRISLRLILIFLLSKEIVQTLGIVSPVWVWMYMHCKLQTNRKLCDNWFSNGSKEIYNNVYELLKPLQLRKSFCRNYKYKKRISWNSWGKPFAVCLKNWLLLQHYTDAYYFAYIYIYINLSKQSLTTIGIMDVLWNLTSLRLLSQTVRFAGTRLMTCPSLWRHS